MAEFSSGACDATDITCEERVCILASGHNGFGQIKPNGIPKINRSSLIKEAFLGEGSLQDILSTWRFVMFTKKDRVSVLGSVEPSEKHQVRTVQLPWMMKKILLSPDQSQLVGLTSDNALVLSEEANLLSPPTIHNNSLKYENMWRTHEGVLAHDSFDQYSMLTFQKGISSVKFPLKKGTAVSHVSCGHCHSLILTADHSVYAYGTGKHQSLCRSC